MPITINSMGLSMVMDCRDRNPAYLSNRGQRYVPVLPRRARTSVRDPNVRIDMD